MRILKEVRMLLGDMCIIFAFKTYPDGEPLKLSLAVWMHHNFGVRILQLRGAKKPQ